MSQNRRRGEWRELTVVQVHVALLECPEFLQGMAKWRWLRAWIIGVAFAGDDFNHSGNTVATNFGTNMVIRDMVMRKSAESAGPWRTVRDVYSNLLSTSGAHN